MSNSTDPAEFLTVDQVAALLHRTPNAVYTDRHRGIGVGALGVKVGKRVLYRRSDVYAYFETLRDAQRAGAR